jgi:hypothetical protein
MRQLLLCKWERDAPDAGPAHCTLQYTRPCGRVKCSLWLGVTFVNPLQVHSFWRYKGTPGKRVLPNERLAFPPNKRPSSIVQK